MKAVQLLVNSYLPPDIQDHGMKMDAGGLEKALLNVARDHPDKFKDIAQQLANAGRNASWERGTSLRLNDLKPVIDMPSYYKAMDKELDRAKFGATDDDAWQDERRKIWLKWQKKIEQDTMAAGTQQQNSLVTSVSSGARGKNPQVAAMIGSPGIYQDSLGNIVPLFVRNSFSQGLRPAELLATTYGARSSVVSTKVSTARGGDTAKQMAQATADLVVTTKDCGTKNGIDLDIDDDSLRGRLSTDGRVLDKRMLADLRNSGLKKVLVRSAITCEAPEGLCAKCLGLQANGSLPPIGFMAGITGAHAISEPITQSALNSKHTSGVASAKKEYSGFGTINQFIQAPEEFPDAAAVSREHGLVESIRDAPQGGKIITIEGREHYALPGMETLVKPGDTVEKGDQLSGGLMNPSDVVETRGLGEGRRYYADKLKTILDDSGMRTDRRNTEMLARGALRHVRIDDADEDESWLPDDLVDYNKIRADWKVPADAKEMHVDEAKGKWLVTPALHFTIGTQLTPRMTRHLKDSGIPNVTVTNTQPQFHAEMPRLRTASHVQDDWLASQSTSYLKGQLMSGAERGADTDIQSNLHYAPRLAFGEGFGQNTAQTGKF